MSPHMLLRKTFLKTEKHEENLNDYQLYRRKRAFLSGE